MSRGHVGESEDVERGMAQERSCLAPRREPLNVIRHTQTDVSPMSPAEREKRSAEAEFMSRWFSQWGSVTHRGVGAYWVGEPPEPSLKALLELDRRDVGEFANDLLALPVDGELGSMVRDAGHAVHAYQQFQDLLEIVMDGESRLEGRHYAYYESLVYLREGVASLLAGRFLASIALARPFLELAITHVYWKTKCDGAGYGEYYRWLDGKHQKPPFRAMLEWSVKHLPVASEVRGPRLDQLVEHLRHTYRQVCAYHHTPSPTESVVTMGGGLAEQTIYPLVMSLTQWTVLLREVVHLYVLTYPMALFPVPVHERFGFSPPIGLLVDESTTGVIARYLSPGTLVNLKQRLERTDLVKERLEYFHAQPGMTEADLEQSWQAHRAGTKSEDDVVGLPHRLARTKSLARAMGWVTNYVKDPEIDEDIPDEVFDSVLTTMRDWR